MQSELSSFMVIQMTKENRRCFLPSIYAFFILAFFVAVAAFVHIRTKTSFRFAIPNVENDTDIDLYTPTDTDKPAKVHILINSTTDETNKGVFLNYEIIRVKNLTIYYVGNRSASSKRYKTFLGSGW